MELLGVLEFRGVKVGDPGDAGLGEFLAQSFVGVVTGPGITFAVCVPGQDLVVGHALVLLLMDHHVQRQPVAQGRVLGRVADHQAGDREDALGQIQHLDQLVGRPPGGAHVADAQAHRLGRQRDGLGGDDFVLTFKTGEDYLAPRLERGYPAINAKNVELHPIISLTYDEELDPTSVINEIFKLERFDDKSEVEGTLEHHVVDKRSVLNFFPDQSIYPDELYVTRVYPGLKDYLGNEIGITTSLPFTTGTDGVTITSIDNFESGVGNWWQPDGSGSSKGYLEGIYRDANSEITNTLTASVRSMELFYHWDVGADSWLIREFLDYVSGEGNRWGLTGNGSESSRAKAKYSTVHHYYCVLKALFNWCILITKTMIS